MKRDKVLSSLGMAQRAGRVASGELAVEKAVKSFRAHLVIVAEDASELTKKKIRNMASFYEVPVLIYGTKETLGQSLGKEMRASAAVLDPGFADSIIKKTTVLQ